MALAEVPVALETANAQLSQMCLVISDQCAQQTRELIKVYLMLFNAQK